MRLLIIEDEKKLAKAIKQGLSQEGFAVDTAGDGESGLADALAIDYDAFVIDWMLPELNGVEVIKQIRKEGIKKPILMLTAKDNVGDRVKGLDSGADDYLAKPFAFEELVARLRALLRRPATTKKPILSFADLQLDSAHHTLHRGSVEIELSAKEFALIEYLMNNPGKIISKSELIEHVWDFDADILDNTVEAFIASLRRKIEAPFTSSPKLIETKRGIGYLLKEYHV